MASRLLTFYPFALRPLICYADFEFLSRNRGRMTSYKTSNVEDGEMACVDDGNDSRGVEHKSAYKYLIEV